mmetsp:Transcript_96443/g.287808  ORF Transcript_96443/g.287808 Transcript_96443/m.287808 type:complete len:249 (-) Transcript_96443:2007-2753(-)
MVSRMTFHVLPPSLRKMVPRLPDVVIQPSMPSFMTFANTLLALLSSLRGPCRTSTTSFMSNRRSVLLSEMLLLSVMTVAFTTWKYMRTICMNSSFEMALWPSGRRNANSFESDSGERSTCPAPSSSPSSASAAPSGFSAFSGSPSSLEASAASFAGCFAPASSPPSASLPSLASPSASAPSLPSFPLPFSSPPAFLSEPSPSPPGPSATSSSISLMSMSLLAVSNHLRNSCSSISPLPLASMALKSSS